MNMVRLAGRHLRRIFGNRHHDSELCEDCRRRNAAALAVQLSGVEGAGLISCRCGSLLTPIVVGDSAAGAEVVAVACVQCRSSMRVAVGILIDPAAPETLH